MAFLCLYAPAAFLKHIVLSNVLGIVSQVQRGGQAEWRKGVARDLHYEVWPTAFSASLSQNSWLALSRHIWVSAGGLLFRGLQGSCMLSTYRCDGIRISSTVSLQLQCDLPLPCRNTLTWGASTRQSRQMLRTSRTQTTMWGCRVASSDKFKCCLHPKYNF